jgi:hypothetical protein
VLHVPDEMPMPILVWGTGVALTLFGLVATCKMK